MVREGDEQVETDIGQLAGMASLLTGYALLMARRGAC